jgi:hypothetical protein
MRASVSNVRFRNNQADQLNPVEICKFRFPGPGSLSLLEAPGAQPPAPGALPPDCSGKPKPQAKKVSSHLRYPATCVVTSFGVCFGTSFLNWSACVDDSCR